MLGLVAFAIGGSYVRLPEVAANARYYQETMAPAVMFACGRGFVNPQLPLAGAADADRALHAFLLREVDYFDCASLPSPLPTQMTLTGMQEASRYLQLAVGAVWRVSGLSWSSMWWAFAALYGLVAMVSYFSFRAVLSRPGSVLLAVALIGSPLQLLHLPHLRDYSKAPFFVAMLFIALRLVRAPLPTRSLLAWSACAGAIIGVSVGVRFDMVMFLVFFAVVVALFLPGSMRAQAGARVAAIAVCLLTFLVVASPLLASFRLGNNSWHVVVLGLAKDHDDAMGIRPANYNFGVLYNDSYVSAVVNGYRQRTNPGEPLARLESPEYLKAAGDYFATVARTFPADLALRVWGALLQICSLPLQVPTVSQMNGWSGEALGLVAALRLDASRQLESIAQLLPIVIAIGIAAVNVRLSLLCLTALLFFAGLSTLQFQVRHIFHVELIPMLVCAVALEWVVRSIKHRMSAHGSSPTRSMVLSSMARVSAVAAAVVVVGLGSTVALRAVQQRQVGELFRSYNDSVPPLAPPVEVASASGTARFYPSLPDGENPGPLRTEFLVADFSGAQCDFDRVVAIARYEASDATVDFSRPIDVFVGDDPANITRVFFSAYAFDQRGEFSYRFVGLELSTANAQCLRGFGRVLEHQRLPLLVDAQLHEGWTNRALFKTLERWEDRPADEPPDHYMFPPGAEFTKHELARPFQPLGRDVDYSTPIVTFGDPGQLSGRGRPARPFAYLAQWRPAQQAQHSLLIVEGELTQGEIAVGLEQDRQWASFVPVTRLGRFRVVIRVPAAGDYGVVLASNDRYARRVEFEVTRIGWIEPFE